MIDYDYLTKHIQSKHKGIKYACNHCDKQYTLQSSLTTHIQSVHEGIRYTCDQCGYQATQQIYLTKHIQSAHEGVMYACNQCDQQFTKQDLATHRAVVHQGQRFYCRYSDCLMRTQPYRDSSNRDAHEREIHGASFDKAMLIVDASK